MPTTDPTMTPSLGAARLLGQLRALADALTTEVQEHHVTETTAKWVADELRELASDQSLVEACRQLQAERAMLRGEAEE